MPVAINVKLQTLLTQFKNQIGEANVAKYNKFYTAISASDALLGALNTKADQNGLTKISFGRDGHGAGNGAFVQGAGNIVITNNFLT